MTYSIAIDEAVEKAVASGNEVVEISTGWTKVREVVHMKNHLSPRLREILIDDERLRHWTTERTPHNKSEEGFTDDREKVAITFPR